MKKIVFFLFVLPFLSFSQTKTDFFIQFNTGQLHQKLNQDSVAIQSVFKPLFKSKNPNFIAEFITTIDQSKAIIVHGNITDSIPFTQITIPIKEVQKIESLLEKEIALNNETKVDSLKESIKKFPNYSLYSSDFQDYSMAWNANYFILYNSSKTEPKAEVPATETAIMAPPVTEENGEIISETSPESTPEVIEVPPPPSEVTNPELTAEIPQQSQEEWDKKFEIEQEEINRKAKKIKHELQEKQIADLFANEFVCPSSSKINASADVSAWLDYQSFYEKITSFNNLFRSFLPKETKFASEMVPFVKGMNLDFYFESNQAKISQSLEYSEEMASIMKKIINRKPNKRIFNFFPKQKPIGYFTYLTNTEESLKSYPQLMNQIFAPFSFAKEDAEMITDLISTILDEKATATLLDGDFSLFFHQMESYESKYISTTYDENFEAVETEKSITQNRPIFSLVLTSTHPTMANKLLDLGVRKHFFTKENNHYLYSDPQKKTNLILFKVEDVVVITNGLNYLNENNSSDFSKDFSKELRNNYFVAHFDLEQFVNNESFQTIFGANSKKWMEIGQNFDTINWFSSKKISDNKLRFEFELHSKKSNNNILLQMFDFFKK